MISLKEKFNTEVVPAMMEKFGYENVMAVPEIEKVVVNVGLGKLLQDKSGKEKKKILEPVLQGLALITGQRPVITKAQNSISGFEVQKGDVVGAKLTLRGKRMRSFLEKLINVALPRIRDFNGIDPDSFDRAGNLTLGFEEHLVFPEIPTEKEQPQVFGLEVTVVTTTDNRQQGIELLKLLGFPIRPQSGEKMT